MKLNNKKNKKSRTTKLVMLILLAFLGVVCLLKGIQMAFPIKYIDYVEEYSNEYNIDNILVLAMIKTESNFDEFATSRKDAKGLMQIMDDTALWANESIKIDDFSTDMLYDPKINIQIGTWYLKWLLDKFGDEDLAILAYNAGHGNVSKWLSDKNLSSDGVSLDSIPFEETNNYLLKVKFNYSVYNFLYGKLGRYITDINI